MELSINEKLLIRFLYDWIRPIRPGDLRKHLDVKHSTLNWQLDALQKKGFVVWEKYGPVSLTEKGRAIAEHHLRHAAILESFLLKLLMIDEKLAHEESMTLGPLMSCSLVEAVSAFLEHPEKSPCCGDIPPKDVCASEE